MTEIAVHRPPTGRAPAERMGFFTDTTTCIGCKACEVACKQWNDLPADNSGFQARGSYDHTTELNASTWRHVRFIELDRPEPIRTPMDGLLEEEALDLVGMAEHPGLDKWIFMSDVCKHCVHAGCLDACPTGALIRTEFETVILQPDVCNGCGYCVPACPFGVVDRNHDDGRAAKCTLCYDRLEDGLEPACAKACPTDSIQFGPWDELVDIAQRRVGELHQRGVEGAYLYGTDPDLAGTLGAFFLFTEEPETYGLPANADSPIQEGAVPATVAAVSAGLAAAVGVALAFVLGKAQEPPRARARALSHRRRW
jgi:formate dehydrogenase iron-sulfur subunit